MTFLLLAMICGAMHAAELYPKTVPIRYFGSDQGRVGSCEAEAEVTALEQAFANRGYPVRLSTFYRHAKNWQGKDLSKEPDVGLVYSARDIALLNAAGALIPDYMWPEDGVGLEFQDVGLTRPSVSEQALIDPAFPTAESLGFGKFFKSFTPGFSNSVGPAQLRSDVANGAAVVLSIHGDILEGLGGIFNDRTGLPEIPYVGANFASLFKQETNHSVAVVGFDDALQAYIIHNTWNSPSVIEIDSSMKYSAKEVQDLLKMRLKIAPRNLPGYYALPYAYVNDLAASRRSGYNVLTLNYAAYGEAYLQFAQKYKIAAAPFSCDRENVHRILNQYRVSAQKAEMQALVMNEATRDHSRIFSFAKLSVNPQLKEDRVRQFYAGAFKNYYCGPTFLRAQVADQWPGADFNTLRDQDPRLDEVMKLISAQPTTPLGWNRWFNVLVQNLEKGTLGL